MNNERLPQHESHEQQVSDELREIAQENLEQHEQHHELSAEQAGEQQKERAEAAREVLKRHDAEPDPAPAAEAAPRPTFVARLDRLVNYTQTMQSLQRRLTPASRTFSRVIHQPAVERTAEAMERTVMRPSVATGALWAAAIAGLVTYLVARHFGYQLSGSEMLVSLLAGAVIGLACEGLGRAVRRRG